MSDLGEILGSILSAISHARRIADEESALLAEHYRQHPLLEGMTVPRIRIPEVIIDLPLLIDKFQGRTDEEVAPAAVVVQKAREALKEEASAQKLKLPAQLDATFTKELQAEMSRQAPFAATPPAGARSGARESAMSAVDNAINNMSKRPEFASFFGVDKSEMVRGAIRRAADAAAVSDTGKPSRVDMTVDSESVKARGGAGNVVRIQLVLKEEGLEWTQSKGEDGSVRRRLIPE